LRPGAPESLDDRLDIALEPAFARTVCVGTLIYCGSCRRLSIEARSVPGIFPTRRARSWSGP